MRLLHAHALAAVLGALCSLPVGDEAAIRLPSGPAKPVPPAPAPDAVQKLAGDQLYVIDSDLPAIVLASPAGLVSVTEDAGPVKIRGRFVDGSGKPETRTYKGKAVFVVEATASGRVELLVVPAGAKSATDVVRRTLDVDAGHAPQPPPPDPKPDDKGDAPIPAAGLRVLVVFESADAAALTAKQQAAIYGKATRDILNSKCVVGPDGKTREWRIFDKDVDAAADSKLWGDAMKRPRRSLPWLVVSNGAAGFEGPLESAEQVAELVKKFGG